MSSEVKVIITGDTAQAVGAPDKFEPENCLISRIKKNWFAISVVLGIRGDYEICNW